MKLKDKTALVTGASTGIGRATAILLAQEGAKVIVNYHSNSKAAEEVVKEANKFSSAISFQVDVTSSSAVQEMIGKIIEQFGKIDILVNNAGGLLDRAPMAEMPEGLWDQVMDLNVRGTFLPTRYTLPFMLKNNFGRIVNVSSAAARTGGGPGAVAYATAKAAVIGFTKGLALELAETGITANCVAPGITITPFHDKYTPPEARKVLEQKVPMKRWGKPEESASAIVYFCMPEAAYITGQTLDVNGGWWMG